MANIRKWLEHQEKRFGEPIEAIVVGRHYNAWSLQGGLLDDEGVVLSREDGLAKLDLEFDSGYGSIDCYPCYAWTASRVFMVHEYDASTGISWVPRNPMAVEPEFSGQT